MRALLLAWALALSTWAFADQVFETAKRENLRTLKTDVLEILTSVPPGTTLSIPQGTQPEYHLYRLPNGEIQRSSNGFLSNARILAVRPEHNDEFPPQRIAELNGSRNWISVTAIPVRDTGEFPALQVATPEADFLLSFEENGKPKFNFSTYYQKRFHGRLNLTVSSESQSNSERLKWAAIMDELQKAADRTVQTSTKYLYLPIEEARKASVDYETKDIVPSFGAWTIAVRATAVRNGFPNVPCAEFMSELLRQAYGRAGHDLFEDFSREKGTYLIWSTTAAVVNLANTLVKAGWIPWELATYRPPTGAIMAHFKATTPGHVYMAAGNDGRIIIDNGSPAGRQLGRTSDKTIKMLYYGGVFFLPPGILPRVW